MSTSALRLASRNAAALWTALARARGHDLVRRPGFLAVGGPRSLRVLLLDEDPGDLGEVADLVRAAPGRVLVEDPFAAVDVADLGLVARPLEVMWRTGPAPEPAPDVTPVRTPGELATAARLAVEGFPFPGVDPAELAPPGLLAPPGVEVLIAWRSGEPAGVCLTIVDEDDVAGLYWVATLPAHRSKGVGRALTATALHRADRVATLTATTAGAPLYGSLGFTTAGVANWWSRPAETGSHP
ncbi:GNAT family N-acetyltransferase [Actinosynnema sp. NPDC020468]|uniref:GNAT family N-acetyltransferase n=1 Tax=Actinosynnema sp. NPDC020468 TaxID=3154488 RepID=UPI0033C2BD95